VIELAQAIARNCGYSVFPCGQDKAPAIPKLEGGNGFHDASRDPDAIARLFSHRNAALIGAATGKASGVSVLDVDAGRWPKDAKPSVIEKHEAARAWWHANAKRLPATRIYESASGGLHVFFRHHPFVGTGQSVIHSGVDTRGDGGYVVFWYAHGFACHDHSPPAEWPLWLLREMKPPTSDPRPGGRGTAPRREAGQNVEDVIRRALSSVGTAGEGQKHSTVLKAARLLGGIQTKVGFSDQKAVEWVKDALPDTVNNWGNVEKTVEYGLESGRNEPIKLKEAS
jgi:hypothetical protein